MTIGWNIYELKKQIAEFHQIGKLSGEVINNIVINGICAPIESEIFDYKENQDSSPTAIAKLVRHIVSFYNSYGGYLLFGVRETIGEELFQVVGVNEQLIDLESIKAKIRDYIGERIQINGINIQVKDSHDTESNLFLMYIPKRPENGRPPAHFHKDGPGQIFQRDDVYHRVGDECIPAKGPKLFELSQPRPNPYLSNQNSWNFEQLFSKRIENNLPDRNFICPRFVGRDVCLDAMWKWLGDDLSYVKMLAGEGGLGKTSIAYEFANRLSQIPQIPYEQIIWLTAKKKQFVGQYDDYISVPETHYSSYQDLLFAIIQRLPLLINEEELKDYSLDELRRLARDGLADYSSFVVIDDIDSLNSEEQRQVVELGFLLGAVRSKLLLTTRHNLAYSHDYAISIGGFNKEEFDEYLGSLRERNILCRNLSSNEVQRLHQLTEGSPLYTESVCRLLKFSSFNDALKGWGKNEGSKARAAALDREISMLSPEAKRILLTASLLIEASVPEISEVTEYPQDVVSISIQELNSLFLLASETLGDQPRFSVPENTIKLVLEQASSLVTDHKRLTEKVASLRGANKAEKSRDHRVGLAIAQAQALLRQGDNQAALATIDDARKRIPGNYDLLSYRSVLLMRFNPPRFEEARRNARDAFNKGCRRPSMFFAWFEAEWSANHFIGAEEVANEAIKNGVSTNADWNVKLAAALVSKAEDSKVGISLERKIGTFFEASNALARAIKLSRNTEAKEWEKILFDIHDRIWKLVRNNLDGIDGIDMAVESLGKIWEYGDYRFINANHALTTLHSICLFMESPVNRKSKAAILAAEIRLGRCRKMIENRLIKFPEDSRNEQIKTGLNEMLLRYERISEA